MSRELDIQVEVGRRLREAIGRAHDGHVLKVNNKFSWNKDDEDFVHAHRPTKFRRAVRNEQFVDLTVNGIEDDIATNMVPPSLGDHMRRSK